MSNEAHPNLGSILESVESIANKSQQTLAVLKWMLGLFFAGILYMARAEYVDSDQTRAIMEIVASLKDTKGDVRGLEKDVSGIKGRLGLAALGKEEAKETTN